MKKKRPETKDPLDTLAVPVKRPVGGADVTLAVYALVRLLFSFKRLRLNLPWTRKNTTTTASIPSVVFLSYFFRFGNGGGEHAKGRITPCKGQSWILDSTP